MIRLWPSARASGYLHRAFAAPRCTYSTQTDPSLMSALDDASLKRAGDAETSTSVEQPNKRLKAESSSAGAISGESVAHSHPDIEATVHKSIEEKGSAGGAKKWKKDRLAKIVKARGGRVAPPPSDPDAPKVPKLPKKACALLIGFSGTGFNGMQMCVPYHSCVTERLNNVARQPLHAKVRSIENVLYEALVEAGAVSKDNSDDPNKVSFPVIRLFRTTADCFPCCDRLVSLVLPAQMLVFMASSGPRAVHCESLLRAQQPQAT